MNGLISFQKKLSREFINHIENTKNLCIYKLGHHIVPKEIIFPNASHITLINRFSSDVKWVFPYKN